MQQAGKKPGEVTVGGIDGTRDDRRPRGRLMTATLDQQLYLQGFLPVPQCVLSKRYGFTGLSINTGSGVWRRPRRSRRSEPLTKAGIR